MCKEKVQDVLETRETAHNINKIENNIVDKTELVTNYNKENENVNITMEEGQADGSKTIEDSENSEICTKKNTNEKIETKMKDNTNENSKQNEMIPNKDTEMNDVQNTSTESDKKMAKEDTTALTHETISFNNNMNSVDSKVSEKNNQSSSKTLKNKKSELSSEKRSNHNKFNKKKPETVEKKQIEPRFGLTTEMIEEEEKLRVEQEKQLNEIKEKVCLMIL